MKTQIKFKSYLTRLRGLMLTLITLLMLGVVQVHADSWTKVTSAPASWAGEYLLVYENESSPTAGKAWTGVDEASCGADVTISSNTISTKPDAAVSITVAAVTGGYSIKINGGTNNGKYLGRSANSNGMDFSTTAVVNTFSFESNSVKIVGAGNAVLRYNSSSGQYRFRYFKSSSYSSQKTIQLYKKSASSCTSITPSLSYTSTSLVVGGTSSSPTVSGNSGSGAVTYSSSDTDVATVNSSTGVVTAVGAGSATITASIASATSGGTTYCSGSATASFTISLPRYTVSFSTGTGNPTQANIQEANAGDGIELPDGPTPACSSNGWEFAGWATSSCSESAIAPILYLPGDTYYPESDETLYAVYRKLSSGTSTASFAASNISNLTEHPVYNLDWLHTASGAELYIEAGQRYTGNPAAWNVTSGTSHYAILDAHRKISGISITVTDGSKYKFGSVESDAGTATLTTSSNTQTVSCSGNVTRVVLYAGSSYQVRATNITITYYNSNFNSNPTCCTQLGTINGSIYVSREKKRIKYDLFMYFTNNYVKYRFYPLFSVPDSVALILI